MLEGFDHRQGRKTVAALPESVQLILGHRHQRLMQHITSHKQLTIRFRKANTVGQTRENQIGGTV